MASSIVRGRFLIADHERVIPGGALFQQDGVIVDVGSYQELSARYSPDQELGSDNFVVIPGLVDSHYHAQGITTFQLGALDDSLEMCTLAWRALPLTDPYLDTMLAAIRLVGSGVTTVLHSNITRRAAEYESGLREGLRAYVDLGLRVAYGVNIRTQNNFVYQDDEQFAASLPSELRSRMASLEMIPSSLSVERCLGAFDMLRSEFGQSDRVRIVFVPTSPQWCSVETLRAIKNRAGDCGAGLQMHVLETPYQRSYGWRETGRSLVEYLHQIDMLGPNVSLAHCVWVNDRDLEILSETSTSVVHNPSSNLRLRSGIAPVTEMIDRGINVGIGTDSETLNDDEDMLQEIRLAAKLHSQPGIGRRFLTSREALRMATSNGARIAQFGGAIGVLEPGRQADAVLLRLDRLEEPYLDPSLDMIDVLLYRAKAGDVDTVVVGGEVIMKGGKTVKIDRDEIVARITEYLRRMPPSALAEVEEKRRFVQALKPYISAFYEGWMPDRPEPYYLFNSRT